MWKCALFTMILAVGLTESKTMAGCSAPSVRSKLAQIRRAVKDTHRRKHAMTVEITKFLRQAGHSIKHNQGTSGVLPNGTPFVVDARGEKALRSIGWHPRGRW